jgi:hypothetical protein
MTGERGRVCAMRKSLVRWIAASGINATPRNDASREAATPKDDGRSIMKGWAMTLRTIKGKKIT